MTKEGGCKLARAENVIQTMTSDVAHMGRAHAQHIQMIAAEVREEMFRDRNVFEQYGAQDIVALKHMMTQFENQEHVEINREASEDIQYNCANANPFSEAKSVT